MLTSVEVLKIKQLFTSPWDREQTYRDDGRYNRKIKQAKLRERACLEDIDYATPRGVKKLDVLSLGSCDWIKKHQNILITGPTGIGKTYLACAFAQRACRMGYSSMYLRSSRVFPDLCIAKEDGRYTRLMNSFARTEILIFDDWGLSKMKDEHRRDFLEIIEDRNSKRSTIITSQLPPEKWYEVIGEPTLADAILDRILHNSHRINLTGDSIRKKKSNLTKETRLK